MPWSWRSVYRRVSVIFEVPTDERSGFGVFANSERGLVPLAKKGVGVFRKVVSTLLCPRVLHRRFYAAIVRVVVSAVAMAAFITVTL